MAASSFHDGHPVNPDRTWLELARRSLRNRATAWLLLCGLLLGQSALYLHHLEHALHADNDACSLCLIGEHTSAGPLAAASLSYPPIGHDLVVHCLPPSVFRCDQHVFRARAQPALLPG